MRSQDFKPTPIVPPVTIEEDYSPDAIAEIRRLFREYEQAIGVDLCFQQFQQELDTLPGKYAPPDGRLLLAKYQGVYCGCVGLRPLAEGICEMKRLYIKPEFRNRKIARLLVKQIITLARDRGYEKMRLDTLRTMKAATALYRSFGFVSIQAYYDNPLEGVLYLELDLRR